MASRGVRTPETVCQGHEYVVSIYFQGEGLCFQEIHKKIADFGKKQDSQLHPLLSR